MLKQRLLPPVCGPTSSHKAGRICILSSSHDRSACCSYLSLPPCPTVSSYSDPVSCFLLVSAPGVGGMAGAEESWEPSPVCQVCGFELFTCVCLLCLPLCPNALISLLLIIIPASAYSLWFPVAC